MKVRICGFPELTKFFRNKEWLEHCPQANPAWCDVLSRSGETCEAIVVSDADTIYACLYYVIKKTPLGTVVNSIYWLRWTVCFSK